MPASEEKVVNRHSAVDFEFTIVLDGIEDLLNDPAAGAFYDAGCDDATLAIINGVPRLTFAREADSLQGAVLSAVRDVLKVIRQFPTVRIVRIEAPGYRFIQSLDAILTSLPDAPFPPELLEGFLNAFEDQKKDSQAVSVS